MKKLCPPILALMLLSTLFALGQTDYPEQDTDYKSSWQEDYRGDGFITYTYYLENLSNDPIVFYNFKVKPNEDRYEILKSYPSDILLIYPRQKTSYLQVKVYTNGPALTWNSKFLRPTKEASSYPVQNKDYVYFWKSSDNSGSMTTYSYHLKNISEKNIKFYDFTLTDNGGIYYMIDNLLKSAVITEPGESIQLVRYNQKSGETPSVNWYADWATFSAPSGDLFCSGLNKILDASIQEGFSTIRGALKQKANDTDTFFDSYYCKEHIDGLENEAIDDLLFFWQYSGQVGSAAPKDIINQRFYEYKSKIQNCLPDFPERPQEDDNDGLLKVEFEAEVDYLYHYVRLEVLSDYETSNYILELVVEEVY